MKIRTLKDLDDAVDLLSLEDLRNIVKQTAHEFYVVDSWLVDRNKDPQSINLETIEQSLTSRGIRPSEGA